MIKLFLVIRFRQYKVGLPAEGPKRRHYYHTCTLGFIAGFIAISVLPYVLAALPVHARGVEVIPSTMHARFPKVFAPVPYTADACR